MQRKSVRRSAVLMGMVGALVVPLAVGAFAAPPQSVDPADAEALQKAVASGSTGAAITVTDGEDVQNYGAGTVSSGGDEAPTADHKFRVASHTKTFVATVVLQLVQEGKLELDGPIGDYLPGLVKGEGIDEQKITVRHLLQHTSGLADYAGDLEMLNPIYQVAPPAPEELVSMGLRHGSQSAPGSTFAYSNTNYVILGLLIQEVAGRSLGDELDQRIIDPLGLGDTRFPEAGDKAVNGLHFRGYVGFPLLRIDVTGWEPGRYWAAGALISTGSDLNTFADALLRGKLLDDDMLGEMKITLDDTPYGLGLMEVETECGKAWGHNGIMPGYFSQTLNDGNGRSVYTAANAVPNDLEGASEEMLRIANKAFCGNAASDDRAGSDRSDGSEGRTMPIPDASINDQPSLQDLLKAGFEQERREK